MGRALGLAAALAAPPPADSEVKEATRIRNGLLRLPQEKMALVRKAAARPSMRRPSEAPRPSKRGLWP